MIESLVRQTWFYGCMITRQLAWDHASQTSPGLYVSFENTAEKGKIAYNRQFLLFPQCFLPIWRKFCHFHQIWKFRLQTLSIWKSLKFVIWERVKNLLTHYQTTNFRLFQTERVCRRQFQIWRKWQKAIQTDRKHCGKRRNCSLRAISPFPTVFSNGLFPRGVKRCHCVGMG